MLLSTITPYGYGFIGFILFSLFITLGIKRRMEKKKKYKNMGCMSMGYIWLIIFSIGSLSIMITSVFISKIITNTNAILNGERYEAKVVDWTSDWKKDNDGEEILFYQPILEFTTREGKVLTHNAGFSSSASPVKGEIYTIYYNEHSDHIFLWGKHVILFLVGMILMGSVSVFAFWGIIRYAAGKSMDSYWHIGNRFLFVFFLPTIIIAFDALLIYALATNDDFPFWATTLVSFFIFVLTMVVYSLIKMLINKGMPKWKRTSVNTWGADWEEENTK